MEELVRAKEDRGDILGKFAEPEDYDTVINEDCDLYNLNPLYPDRKDESNIIFKFRKGVFTDKEQKLAYEGLRDAATESQNRGMAAGPRGDVLGSGQRSHRDWVTPFQEEVIDYFSSGGNLFDSFPTDNTTNEETRGRVWLRSKVIGEKYGEYDGWFVRWIERMQKQPKNTWDKEASEVSTMISDTNYAQTVLSGIAGYFDRYPRIPHGRACGYNEKYPEKFAKCFPYVNKLNDVFKKELPVRWGAQNQCAQKLDPRFRIDKSVFTTLTINYNWRTAGHRDAGDLSSGFSNISGIGKGWKGFIFTLPEWKIGINLQPGDLLLVNNHEGIHTNTAGIGEDNDRVSIVAYFREKMLNLQSYEYEMLRKQFVEERRGNKEHALQRNLWNGVSPGMWDKDEWKEYMKSHDINDPYVGGTLEGFL
jgi:hypothetical protein|tara:strand:- start:3613 stop:4872 length:1260 start_codon:yes stop_codon:yes gene_type:complete